MSPLPVTSAPVDEVRAGLTRGKAFARPLKATQRYAQIPQKLLFAVLALVVFLAWLSLVIFNPRSLCGEAVAPGAAPYCPLLF